MPTSRYAACSQNTNTHTHTHTHITHRTCRHDDLIIQRTSTICRCKPQRLLLHGHQPPVVLACCVQANCQGRLTTGLTQAYCLNTFEGQFYVLSAETHLDTSLSLLLSTRYFCAGSLWHNKQLSAHQAAKYLQDGAEWLTFLHIRRFQ